MSTNPGYVEAASHQGPQLTLPGMKELFGAPQPHPLTDTAQTEVLAGQIDCWRLRDVSHSELAETIIIIIIIIIRPFGSVVFSRMLL